MMALQFLTPIIASVLYVIVFQKAGFKGAMLVICAGPVVGAMLTQLMIRMISSELAGKLLAPDPADVLRTVGNPVNGVCQPA